MDKMELNNNEIHLWYLNTKGIEYTSALEEHAYLLSEEERLKVDQYLFQKDRHQYLLTRVLIRTILSAYVPNIIPQNWRFLKNKYGKPYIENEHPLQGLNFNLSHSKDLIVCALSVGGELGVDVESIKKIENFDGLSERFFTGDEHGLIKQQRGVQKANIFYRLWTLKEAYIKALGAGLSIPLDEFAFEFDRAKNIYFSAEDKLESDPEGWNFWSFGPVYEYTMSLAYRNKSLGSDANIKMMNFDGLNKVQEVNIPAAYCSPEKRDAAFSVGRVAGA